MAGERFTSIQCLRGIAAFCVVFHHAVLLGGNACRPLPASLVGFANFGSCGVDLFFVISGFVMAHSIGDPACRQRPLSFLARRVARIFPLFWILSCVVLVQAGLMGKTYPAASYFNTVTLVPLLDWHGYEYPILYVGWSLGYEIVFYAMVAAVLWRAPDRGTGALLALVGTAASTGLAFGNVAPALAFVANPIFAEFGLGIVAWICWRRGISPVIGGALMVAGGLLLISAFFVDLGQGFSVDPTLIVSGESSLKRAVVWGLPCALIVCGGACTGGHRSGWLAHLGDASYSLYLIHPIVITCLAHTQWSNPYLSIIACCGSSVAAAITVHAAIERPLMTRTAPAIAALSRVIDHFRPYRFDARARLTAD